MLAPGVVVANVSGLALGLDGINYLRAFGELAVRANQSWEEEAWAMASTYSDPC